MSEEIPEGWEVAEYNVEGGKKVRMPYDPKALCIECGLPVEAASMGGTKVCPWCDMGKYRDGTNWGLEKVNVDKMVEGISDFIGIDKGAVREVVMKVVEEMELDE